MFQFAQNVATQGNVLIYSFEMKTAAIKTRMMAAMTGYGATKLQRGLVSHDKLKEANDKMRTLNYYIDDRGALDISEVVSSTLDFHRRHPLKMVVVDYIQLVGSREHSDNTSKFGHVAWELKTLAQRLGITVLTASQLNNATLNDAKQNRRFNDGKLIVEPSQENVKYSGDIFNHADAIIFLHRPEQVTPGDRPGVAEITIGKNRMGPTGKFDFQWLGQSTRFVDPAEGEL
jgi:replicative DNA helicase